MTMPRRNFEQAADVTPDAIKEFEATAPAAKKTAKKTVAKKPPKEKK